MNDEEFIDVDEDGTPTDQTKKLRDKLKKCTEEKQEYLDGWQRAKADLVNFKREAAESRAQVVKAEKSQLIEKLLPILDSFDMAFSGEAWNDVSPNWQKGVEHIHSQFMRTLEEYGVTPFDPQGEQFDPNQHEPIGMEETTDKKKDGVIVSVFQKGYKQGDNVLRPAKVVVYNLRIN